MAGNTQQQKQQIEELYQQIKDFSDPSRGVLNTLQQLRTQVGSNPPAVEMVDKVTEQITSLNTSLQQAQKQFASA